MLPKAKKYGSVVSTLDTGASVSKAKKKPSRSAMLRRMDESFGRLTVAQLYTLLVEAEVPEASPPVSYDDGTGPRRVAHGAEDEAEYTSPLMLVDVRDRAAFDECHIMSASCCPAVSVRQDRIPSAIARLRTRPAVRLVLYDEGEEAAPGVAHRFCTRGFPNVQVLSGGLRAVAMRSPLLVDGEVPAWLLEAPSPSREGARARAAAAAAGPMGGVSPVPSARGSRMASAASSPARSARADPMEEAVETRRAAVARGLSGRSGSAAAALMGMPVHDSAGEARRRL